MTTLSFSSSVMPSIIIWNKPFQIVISMPLGPHHTAGLHLRGARHVARASAATAVPGIAWAHGRCLLNE